MNTNQKKILKELISASSPLTSKQLSKTLDVSTKTILRNIKDLRIIIKSNGAEIITKPNSGTTLIVKNQQKFKDFISLQANNSRLPSSPQERIIFIIDKLLYANDYIKITNLADTMFISPSAINNDMKIVKEILNEHNLKIISKPNYGIKVHGLEKNIRLAISNQYSRRQYPHHSIFKIENDNNLKMILTEIIKRVLIKENLRMSDIAFESLVIHLLIMIERIKLNNILEINQETIDSQKRKNEYLTAMSLKKEIEKEFNIKMPEDEVVYLSLHLSGKKHYESNTPNFMNIIDNDTKILVNSILRSIFDQTRIDFYSDSDLKINLLLHIIPFINRLENNMQIKNPIIEDIKVNHNFAYELASIGLQNLNKRFNAKISEDEIAYFALHFILALERLNDKEKYNILIICNTGKATSQLLAYQMQKYFENSINTIKIIESYLLQTIELNSFQFVFSTVPLDESLDIPVHYISNILSEEDFAKISDVFANRNQKSFKNISHLVKENLFFNNISATTKEEALENLLSNINLTIKIPDNLLQLVLEREKFASTELDNLVAIPHPNKSICSETFISVGVLDKPIYWQTKKVQILFLICINPNNKENLRDFYESLVNFTIDSEKPKLFLENPNYINLIKLLE